MHYTRYRDQLASVFINCLGDKISISCKMCLRDTCAVVHHFEGPIQYNSSVCIEEQLQCHHLPLS